MTEAVERAAARLRLKACIARLAWHPESERWIERDTPESRRLDEEAAALERGDAA